ncbi:hypothetical protein TWF106_001420 [Orbilia oligospora]|uniref:Teneurin-like YD-shell domain-containing protein n=1 Tax=Orbilia oligospora TaxID=2813651 RepID=A0A7C8U8M0_ORBOL|nr:hypothetical protein TWF106_001420 [Orbilia oligospora]
MASGGTKIYSHGFSFSSFIQKGVDPRTGQYTCSVDVFDAPSKALNCPPLVLRLNFSPLGSEDVGFGKGWSFNLSTYQHRQSKQISLSTGEHYQVTETSNGLSVKDKKLKSFLMEKMDDGNYKIVHKSGDVEILSNRNNTYNVSVPIRLYTASGRVLHLTWVRSGDIPKLAKISDGKYELMRVDYNDANTKVVHAPGSSEESTLTFKLRDSHLIAVQLPLNNAPSWTFEYENHNGFLCMGSVRSPTGLIEDIKYQQNGHRLPDGAPFHFIPYAISHTVRPGNQQPPIKTYYSYSNYNFLGYDGPSHWNHGEDNLYRSRSNYEYTSTVSDNNGQTTTSTYNKYHLVTKTVQKKGYSKTTQVTEYHADVFKEFSAQPAYYQLPKTMRTTYENTEEKRSRTEITEYEFDDWGNQVKEVLPTGVRTERTYYSESGDDNCPADPHGFRRYVKTETLTPALSSYICPVRSFHHTYQSLPTSSEVGFPVSSVVALKSIDVLRDDKIISNTQCVYNNDHASRDIGRLIKRVTTLGGKHSTTQQWSFDYTEDRLTQTAETESIDGQTTSSSSTASLVSGLLLSQKDIAGIVVNYEYDKAKQLLRETTALGTKYEKSKSHEYYFPYAGSDQKYQTITTDPSGCKRRVTVDGLGRTCQVEAQDVDGNQSSGEVVYRIIQKTSYNEQGQPLSTTSSDWFRNGTAEPTSQEIVKSLEYDDWGQVSKVKTTSGPTITSTYDPIAQKRTNSNGEGYVTSYYDGFGDILSTERYYSNGQLEGKQNFVYDGLGRLVSQSNALAETTSFEYDDWDRVIETTLPDGTRTRNTYADFSSDALVTQLKALGTDGSSCILGTQMFDSQGRVTSTTNGGKETKFQYSSSTASIASTFTTPRNDVVDVETIPELGDAVSETRTGGIIQKHSYDPKTGRLIESTEGSSSRKFEYTASGLLKHDSILFDGSSEAKTSLHEYSMGGVPQDSKDFFGHTQTHKYDSDGRLQQFQNSPFRVDLTYDSYNRTSSISTTEEGSGSNLKTTIGYDDFGRPTTRELSWNGTSVWLLNQSYNAGDQITQRKLTNGSEALRIEQYKYDKRNRLIQYTCTGNQAPKDDQKRPLQRQDYTYDYLDNIHTIISKFKDGTTDTATYEYAKSDDSVQLTRIKYSNPERTVDFTYDQAGHQIKAEEGKNFEYDASGRQMGTEVDGEKSSYGYNGGEFQSQTEKAERKHLYHQGNSLVGESTEKTQTRYLMFGNQCLGCEVREGDKVSYKLVGTDMANSVLTTFDTNTKEKKDRVYTPFGAQSPDTIDDFLIGFNGERYDPLTRDYLLGGYRAYNPTFGRFRSPDSMSPFGKGGLNSYAYCLNDPINRMDPTGHFSFLGLNGREWAMMIVGTAVGIAVGVATCGAGLAVMIGASVLASAASDMLVGAMVDNFNGKTPTLESMLTDAAWGGVSGLGGELAGRAIGFGIKALRGGGKAIFRRFVEGTGRARRLIARYGATADRVIQHEHLYVFDGVAGRGDSIGIMARGGPGQLVLGGENLTAKKAWSKHISDALEHLHNVRESQGLPRLPKTGDVYLFAAHGAVAGPKSPAVGKFISNKTGMRTIAFHNHPQYSPSSAFQTVPEVISELRQPGWRGVYRDIDPVVFGRSAYEPPLRF